MSGWQVISNFIRTEAIRPFATDLLYWQWRSLLVCLLLCLNPWIIPARWLSSVRLRFHEYAQNRSRAIWTCALFPMIVRVILLPVAPVKPPSVHDEFSFLLMADTFRSGRLTNPTHPYWTHFETIHIIQKPTYNSMYPPGYGAFLALGQIIYHPWIGVLLSVGLMCGAICWMLQAWIPTAWAFVGALIASLQIGIAGYWMNSYMGAPIPAMAGALLLGALPRFMRKPGWGTAAISALGVVFLVNTRPFEGTILSIVCVGAAILWRWVVLASTPIRWTMLAPAALMLLAGGLFTAYYSWRVTGSPLKAPYSVNRETYGWPENLAILPPQKVVYRHQIMKSMHLSELSNRERYATFESILDSWIDRWVILWEFYVGPGLTLPLLMLPLTLRSRKLRGLFYLGLFMLCLNTLQLMAYPQHVSPATSVLYVLLISGMGEIYVIARRTKMLPERLVASLVLCVMCSAGLKLWGESLHFNLSFWEQPHAWHRDARAAVLSKLEEMPGKHIVFVRYSANHTPHEEWVYNSADIDQSKVAWANAMDLRADMDLRKYFRDRHAWIVEPDKDATGFLPLTAKTYTYASGR